MDFFEKLGDTISDKGRKAAEKAKELSEIATLKGQIFKQEEAIKKNYTELGRIYYEQYGDTPDVPLEKLCCSIREAKDTVEKLQAKIKEMKED